MRIPLSFIAFISKTGEVIFTTHDSSSESIHKPDDVNVDPEKNEITIMKGGVTTVLLDLEQQIVDAIVRDQGFTIITVNDAGTPLANHRYGPQHRGSKNNQLTK